MAPPSFMETESRAAQSLCLTRDYPSGPDTILESIFGREGLGEAGAPIGAVAGKENQKKVQECDGITDQVSFRELMRWNGRFTRNIQ